MMQDIMDKDGKLTHIDENGKKTNLLLINGDNKVNELKKSIRYFIENQKEIMEYQEVSARILYHRYEILRKEGFTEKQALELVKTGPI